MQNISILLTAYIIHATKIPSNIVFYNEIMLTNVKCVLLNMFLKQQRKTFDFC